MLLITDYYSEKILAIIPDGQEGTLTAWAKAYHKHLEGTNDNVEMMLSIDIMHNTDGTKEIQMSSDNSLTMINVKPITTGDLFNLYKLQE